MRFLRQRREHELAELTLPNGGAGGRIDGLDKEVILVHVGAALLQAFEGDARAEDLREAVDVESGDPERPFDLRAEGLRPGLCAVNARAKAESAGVLHVVGEGEGIARGTAEDLRAEVIEQLHLAGGVAPRGRDHGAAETLGPVVQTEAAGEQTVAVGDVDDRAWAPAGCGERPGAAVGPEVDVGLGVGDDRRLPARAGRRVDANAALERDAEKPERVGVAQHRLRREGLLLELFGADAEARAETIGLEALELVAWERFPLRLQDHAADYRSGR
jgi:hypothetical protein